MRFPTALAACAALVIAACGNAIASGPASGMAERVQPATGEAVAVFAGGCFWCIESELEELDGVRSVLSGYTGGTTPDPHYGKMGDHAEAVEVIYDPQTVSYDKLLKVFWSNIDPTDEGGQFFDRGQQYRTAIFVLDDEQRALAEASLERNNARVGKPIVTAILPATTFYPAEEYHQDYYLKQPERYEAYKKGSRREETLGKIWGEE
ncbi:MAG: peptide-methionine (S)-S-oxide reductase MsrA [Hyphomonas sp.]